MDYRKAISEYLATQVETDPAALRGLLELPPKPELGDYAFPCFSLAKVFRQAPPRIAAELKSKLETAGLPDFLRAIEVQGGYLNFFLRSEHFIRSLLGEVLASDGDFASYCDPRSREEDHTIVIDYSSPNIAKPFHVGHGFTTVIGAALARIYRKAGFEVVRVNHLGDYGTQFGKLIVAYERWGDPAALEKSAIDELLRIYVLFHQEAEKDPSLEEEARLRFRKLEEGAAREKELFEKFREISIREFNRTYRRIGVDFDSWNGESFYSDKIPEIIDLLRARHLLEESEGAQVVRLEEEGLPPCLILKSDGTTIYASRDLAAALFRYRNYHFAKNMYVVGLPQSLHFKQVFAVLKRMGYAFADRCEHVGFGTVKFGQEHFSTRNGNVVTLEDLLDETVSKTRAIMEKNARERGRALSEEKLSELSEKVGVAAVLYQYLKSGRERDILFSWEEMLDFEGDTAPYLQYTGARAHSVLRQAGKDAERSDAAEFAFLEGSAAEADDSWTLDLLKSFVAYRESLPQALKQNEPFLVARALNQMCRSYNRFYTNCKILTAEDPRQRELRLLLTKAFWKVLKEGLAVLGIEAVEQM